jgi:hypothetical protein
MHPLLRGESQVKFLGSRRRIRMSKKMLFMQDAHSESKKARTFKRIFKILEFALYVAKFIDLLRELLDKLFK